MKEKRVLVTGGSGFLGAPLCLELVRRGWKVVVVDPRIPGWDAPEHERARLDVLREDGRVHWIQGKCYDLQPMAIKPVDGVVHLAAVKKIPPHWPDADRFAAVCGNVSMAGNVLQWAGDQAARGREPLVLLASSAAVYEGGSRLRLMGDSGDRWDVRGMEAYGISKVMVELLAQAAALQRVTQLRFFNLKARAGEHGGGVHAEMRRSARESGEIRMAGDGRQVRDFVEVHDAARWTADVLEAGMGGELPRVMDVCSGTGTTIEEVAREIVEECRSLGAEPRVVKEARMHPGVRKAVGDRRGLEGVGGRNVQDHE